MSAVDGQPDAGRRAGRALRVAATARRGAKAMLRHTAASGFAAAARAVLSIVRTPQSDMIRQVDVNLRINYVYILSQLASLHFANL